MVQVHPGPPRLCFLNRGAAQRGLPGLIKADYTRAEQLLDVLLMNGGVAQLGERLPCTQEVIGSIPFTSTIFMVEFLLADAKPVIVYFL